MATLPNTITRRAALTGTAAVTAALATGTAMAAGDHLDAERAEWLALWQHMLEQSDRACDARNDYDEARFAARHEHPTPPKQLQYRNNGELQLDARGKPEAVTREGIERHHRALMLVYGGPKHGPTLEQRYRDDIAALDAWEAECGAADARFDVPALEAANEAEQERDTAAIHAIVERPATSVVGIAVKLAMHRLYSGGDGTNRRRTGDGLRRCLAPRRLPEDMGREFDVEQPEDRS